MKLGALVLPLLAGCLRFHSGAMPNAPEDAQYLQIEGTRVRYLDVGQGPAVVLVHGFASSIENWLPVLPELTKTHRVLALDLRGFGWTDRPVADYSPQAQARLVHAVMNARGIERAAVVAHSWGTSVALALALAEPQAVSSLVLYDAWVYESQLNSFLHVSRVKGLGEVLFGLFYDQRPDERMAMSFYDPEIMSEALVEAVERALERPGTKAAALEASRGMRFAELEPKYKTITAPTLILWGREDLVSPLWAGERLSRELPNANLIVYPRCGHFPMIEAKQASNRDLLAFLEQQK